MKLKEEVCSLELAKRLKELGVKQESLFIWNSCENPKIVMEIPRLGMRRDFDYCNECNFFSAFTVAELMYKLPAGFFLRMHGDQWAVVGLGVPWQENGDVIMRVANLIADAPAETLIYLIEQGLVKP